MNKKIPIFINDFFCYGPREEWERLFLEQSLFYYCAGADPSPILAYGEAYPLYIYVDNFIYCTHPDPLGLLYKRLRKYGFRKQIHFYEASLYEDSFIKGEISCWRTPAGGRTQIIYIADDVEIAYQKMYTYRNSLLLPRCICNYKEEASSKLMSLIEKRVPRILGYCFSDRFVRTGEIPYYGDYGHEAISVFENKEMVQVLRNHRK